MDPAVNGYIGAGYFADPYNTAASGQPPQYNGQQQQYNVGQPQYGGQYGGGAQYNTPQYNQVCFLSKVLTLLLESFNEQIRKLDRERMGYRSVKEKLRIYWCLTTCEYFINLRTTIPIYFSTSTSG